MYLCSTGQCRSLIFYTISSSNLKPSTHTHIHASADTHTHTHTHTHSLSLSLTHTHTHIHTHTHTSVSFYQTFSLSHVNIRFIIGAPSNAYANQKIKSVNCFLFPS